MQKDPPTANRAPQHARRRAAMIRGCIALAAAFLGAGVVYPFARVTGEAAAAATGVSVGIVFRGAAAVLTAIAGAFAAMYFYEAVRGLRRGAPKGRAADEGEKSARADAEPGEWE